MPFVWLLVGVVFTLLVVMFVRALSFGVSADAVEPVEGVPVDAESVACHLAQAVRCKTISVDHDHPADRECLQALHNQLRGMYPLIHARLELEIINDHALLYTWPGTDDQLAPILLAAHQDVVPADPATISKWQYPPFDGQTAEGYVWGRGTMDNKHQMIAIMETVETLLSTGYNPRRTVYLGFGHDEEIGGQRGAMQIAAWLQERDIRLDAVLDEGGLLMEGLLPGVEGLVALVGNAEKGYATLELSVTGDPGHSAMPPKHTAIGILGQALARLERHPMPADGAALRPMIEGLGPAAPFVYRFVFANLWLLAPAVHLVLGSLPKTNAMIRTTTAATMISGGVKDNILPREAKARVNSRILIGNRSEQVVAHARRAVRDKRVEVLKLGGFSSEPSPVSPTNSPAYRKLALTIRQTFGDIPVTPFLVIGGTDARHYAPVCENIYRFAPMPVTTEDIGRVHGINERIAVTDLGRMVQFYGHLIRAWADG